MASRISIKYPGASIKFVPVATESRAKAVYENGQRTDRTQVDDKGRALYGFEATVEIAGDRFAAQITSPVQLPDAVPLGVVFEGAGAAVLNVSNQRDAFDLRVGIALENYAPVKA
ncbi:MAG: hypothetical protein FWG11_00125 [Promicromonosporaceae bacterium]|nr:hypothetical protein [Promicromonosporaceae bacterium]